LRRLCNTNASATDVVVRTSLSHATGDSCRWGLTLGSCILAGCGSACRLRAYGRWTQPGVPSAVGGLCRGWVPHVYVLRNTARVGGASMVSLVNKGATESETNPHARARERLQTLRRSHPARAPASHVCSRLLQRCDGRGASSVVGQTGVRNRSVGGPSSTGRGSMGAEVRNGLASGHNPAASLLPFRISLGTSGLVWTA